MTHYYDEKQTAPSEPFKIWVRVDRDAFQITSDNAVFSKDKLDTATELLIETLPEVQGDFLDLGCGYGVVGIAVKRKSDDATLHFVDPSSRAVQLTKKNLEDLGLEGEVQQTDTIKQRREAFDVIATNPPMAAGRKTCYRLIVESYDALRTNGSLYVVARHKKGGKMLAKKIKDVFGDMETKAKKSGFRVYKATK